MPLSYHDLCRVLETKQPKRLRELLKERGIRWIPDRLGRPTTSDAEYDRAISAARRKVTFTRPPKWNNKKNGHSQRACASVTDHGISSAATRQ